MLLYMHIENTHFKSNKYLTILQILLYFGSNKYSLGEQKSHLSHLTNHKLLKGSMFLYSICQDLCQIKQIRESVLDLNNRLIKLIKSVTVKENNPI